MVQFYTPIQKSSKPTQTFRDVLQVTHLDHQGRGLATYKGQPCFVRGALAGEQVKAQIKAQSKKRYEAQTLEVLSLAQERVQPRCHVVDTCGGCDHQHMSYEAQHAYKKEAFQSLMKKFGGIQLPEPVSLLAGDPWEYRRRARLAISFDRKTQNLVLGFRARGDKKVVDIQSCLVMVPELSRLIAPLQDCLQEFQHKKILGHAELLQGYQANWVILRVTQKLSTKDQQRFLAWCERHQVQGVLFYNNYRYEVITDLKQASYQTAGDLELFFSPIHFIQVNHKLNQQMVQQALDWLPKKPSLKVLDLFCGVGNFSLPLAMYYQQVVGVEGVDAMVQQAKANATLHHREHVDFYCADLTQIDTQAPWVHAYDIVVLDPSREGASAAVENMHVFSPTHVLYISCDPVTLARDTKALLLQGYQLSQSCVIDMFPQTKHLESMLLFAKGGA